MQIESLKRPTYSSYADGCVQRCMTIYFNMMEMRRWYHHGRDSREWKLLKTNTLPPFHSFTGEDASHSYCLAAHFSQIALRLPCDNLGNTGENAKIVIITCSCGSRSSDWVNEIQFRIMWCRLSVLFFNKSKLTYPHPGIPATCHICKICARISKIEIPSKQSFTRGKFIDRQKSESGGKADEVLLYALSSDAHKPRIMMGRRRGIRECRCLSTTGSCLAYL